MGALGSKSTAQNLGKDGKAVIHNSTTEEVTLREKNRTVLGPVRLTINPGEEKVVPCSVLHGTYVRYAVCVGGSEQGILSNADLEAGSLVTIRRTESGHYEVLSQKADPSNKENPSHTGAGPSTKEKPSKNEHAPSPKGPSAV